MTLPETSCVDEKTDPHHLKTDSLAASVAILLILTVVQRLVGFLRGILFCRWLSADQLGQWDMAFGFLMLAAPLAVLGIPGSFGRYVEHYRPRGQLKTFLRRTTALCLVLATLVVLMAALGREWCAKLIFGSGEHASLMLILAISLGVVILHNFLHSLLTALRQVKIVSVLQFVNSLVFAVAGIGLLLLWRIDTAGVVIAFGISYALTSAVSLIYLARLWKALPRASAAITHRSLWMKLAPFAFWLWLTNWMSNLFGIADRFMIIHCGSLASGDALGLVGQYHTARLFPMLFVGLAEMLAAVATPHLTRDWESGRKDRVSTRLNLILKSVGLGLVAAAAVVLIGSPLLFDFAWQGRYNGGLAVLPWALVCSIWTALAFLTNNYLWCAEKSRFVTLTLFVGLSANIVLNLLLLPYLGLLGAVLATSAARLIAMCLLWTFARKQGMQLDRGLLVVAWLPLLLVIDPWITLTVLAAVVLGVLPGAHCLGVQEKEQLLAEGKQYWLKLKKRFGRGRLAPG